jgi:hypothetical protein
VVTSSPTRQRVLSTRYRCSGLSSVFRAFCAFARRVPSWASASGRKSERSLVGIRAPNTKIAGKGRINSVVQHPIFGLKSHEVFCRPECARDSAQRLVDHTNRVATQGLKIKSLAALVSMQPPGRLRRLIVCCWPDSEVPTGGPAGPLTEVDPPCQRSEWHGSFDPLQTAA